MPKTTRKTTKKPATRSLVRVGGNSKKSKGFLGRLLPNKQAHWVLLILVMAIVGGVGSWMLTASHAATSSLTPSECTIRGRDGFHDNPQYFCYSSTQNACDPLKSGTYKPNGDYIGYCSRAVTSASSISPTTCSNLGRKWISHAGCARVWQQDSNSSLKKMNYAIQCKVSSNTYYITSTKDYCGPASTNVSSSGWQWPVADGRDQGPSLCWNVSTSSGNHAGLDIDVPNDSHSAVYAVASGTVTFRGSDGGAGNEIRIRHSSSLYSVYEHLSSFKVADNAGVSKGQLIGYTGVSGNTSGEHLHFGVSVTDSAGSYSNNDNTRNPLNYLPKKTSYAGCTSAY